MLDLLIGIIVSITAILGGYMFSVLGNIKYPKEFIYGLIIKIFSALAFLSIYTFYYDKLGDTFNYMGNAKLINEVFYENPKIWLQLLFQPANTFNSDTFLYTSRIPFFDWENSNLIVAKIASLFLLITLGSEYSATILFALFFYFGNYLLFSLIANRYPKLKFEIFIFTLAFPSIVFWGSGIMKDTIVFSLLGVLAYHLFKEKNNNSVLVKYAIIALATIGILSIKAYIIFALIPSYFLFRFYRNLIQIKNKALRIIIFPLIFLLSAGFIAGGISFLGELFPRYSIGKITYTAEKYQSNHYSGENSDREGTRSGYSLGEIDNSITGLILKFPSAVIVTFFRPFIWEIRGIVMLFAALESLFVTLFFLSFFFSRNKKVKQKIFEDPFILFCLVFSILFGFAVGYTSYNFGALVRYKIPCIPFFLVGILLLKIDYSKLKIKTSSPKSRFESPTLIRS